MQVCELELRLTGLRVVGSMSDRREGVHAASTTREDRRRRRAAERIVEGTVAEAREVAVVAVIEQGT